MITNNTYKGTMAEDFVLMYSLGIEQLVAGQLDEAERTIDNMYLSYKTLNLTPKVKEEATQQIDTLEKCLAQKRLKQ